MTNQGLISLDDASQWELAIDYHLHAPQTGVDQYGSIGCIDIPTPVEAEYVTILVTTTNPKNSWKFAGRVSQFYEPTGDTDNFLFSEAHLEQVSLELGKPLLLNTKRLSNGAFRFRYTAPDWFKDFTFKVYRYTGTLEQTESELVNRLIKLFDIGEEEEQGFFAAKLAALEEKIELTCSSSTCPDDDTDDDTDTDPDDDDGDDDGNDDGNDDTNPDDPTDDPFEPPEDELTILPLL